MAAQIGDKTFEFINVSNATGPFNDETRHLIRRQAMSRPAAARRRQGNYGKRNLLQTIVFVETRERRSEQDDTSSETNKSVASDDISAEEHNFREVEAEYRFENTSNAICANLPSTGYERLRLQCGFDLLDLSAMTTFHVGRITAQCLSSEPAQLSAVLQCRQWSYLNYLPPRYGYSACLDDSARCVAVRVQQFLQYPGSPPQRKPLLLYSKALRSLQVAIDDSTTYRQPEVLCATELLAIYELLDDARHEAWVQHVKGATSLVEIRGPEGYETDFEKALFLAQMGPIYTEALINSSVCFLEAPPWQDLLQSIMNRALHPESVFADCSDIVICLWSHLWSLPNIFNDVQDIVINEREPPSHLLAQLLGRIFTLRAKLLRWRGRFQALLLTQNSPVSSNYTRFDKRCETLSVCLAGLILLCRLALALDPCMGSATEDEAQRLSLEINDLYKEVSTYNPRAGLFMAFKMEVARATLGTSEDWHIVSSTPPLPNVSSKGLIKPSVFERWCNLKGRRVKRDLAT